jgi:tetratricopeptide (TPR) repeat protein
MKRPLSLTLCLLATGGAFDVRADPCDNLRNNQQAYRDCVNDWYGRSNRGNAPTPWWKNYDPNAGSGSAPAEAPTLSKQQQIDLQLQRERQQREAEREAAEERRKQEQRGATLDAAKNRVTTLNQHGRADLRAGKASDALQAFNEVRNILHAHGTLHFHDDLFYRAYEDTGHALALLGHPKEAEGWFKKSVRYFDDEVVARGRVSSFINEYNRALNALATFYESQGRLDEAVDLQWRRYSITQKTVYSDHPETIEAAKAYIRTAARREAGAKHDATFKHLNAMNEALQREDYEKALKASEDLLIWAQKENNDGLAALAQRNKAKALIKLNRGGEANNLLKALLAQLDKTPPPLNRSEGFGDKQSALYEVLGGLAEEYESSHGYGNAEPFRRRMLEIQEQTRGPEHLETLAALRALANNLSRFGKYSAAVPVRQRAVAVAEKLPAAQSQLPELRQALLSDYRYAGGFEQEANALEAQIDWRKAWKKLSEEASDFFKARQYAQAIAQGQIALEFAQKHGDARESRVATSQHNLAVYHRAAKQHEQAETLFKKALETYANANGADSPSLIPPLLELTSLYDLQKRHAEAEPLYKRLLPLQEKKQGREHLAVAKTLTKLAEAHARKNQLAEAESLYARALAIVDKHPAADDGLVFSLLGGLAEVYRDTQRKDEAQRLDERYARYEKGLAGK